jgi:hypothetical protein
LVELGTQKEHEIVNLRRQEEYAQPPGWMGKIELYGGRITACPADRILTIDAWDQS